MDPDQCLATDLHRKKSAGNTLLNANSAHSPTLIRSIPYAQYLHLKHNCTLLEDFKKQASQLRSRLLLTGYSKSLLHKAYNRALLQDRNVLLYKPRNNNKGPSPVKFITWFSTQQKELLKILGRHWYILLNDPYISKYIINYPEIIFRRAPSIGDRL